MDLIVTEDYDALSREAAERMARLIAAKPGAALVLATGESPMGAYRELAARLQGDGIDASGLRVFQLDEYLGLGPDDHRSLYGWLKRALLEPLGVPEVNVVRLPSDASDPVAACRAHEEAVRKVGGFDLAVL